MDMVGQLFVGTLSQSLKDGKISQHEIDLACRRVLQAKYKLGLFDKPFQYHDKDRAKQVLLCDNHKAKARELAARSCVLLKNEGQVMVNHLVDGCKVGDYKPFKTPLFAQ